MKTWWEPRTRSNAQPALTSSRIRSALFMVCIIHTMLLAGQIALRPIVRRRPILACRLQDEMVERHRPRSRDREVAEHHEVRNLLEAQQGLQRIDITPFGRSDRHQ